MPLLTMIMLEGRQGATGDRSCYNRGIFSVRSTVITCKMWLPLGTECAFLLYYTIYDKPFKASYCPSLTWPVNILSSFFGMALILHLLLLRAMTVKHNWVLRGMIASPERQNQNKRNPSTNQRKPPKPKKHTRTPPKQTNKETKTVSKHSLTLFFYPFCVILNSPVF